MIETTSLDQLRARNLRRLIDERFGGVIRAFAQAVDIHPTYVSNMLASLRDAKGARAVTAAMAERIELTLGLEPGELSRDPDAPPLARGEGEGGGELEALAPVLHSIAMQREAIEEIRCAVEALREGERASWAVIALLAECYCESTPSLRPKLMAALRAVARPGVAAGASMLREQSELLRQMLADPPPSLEAAARRAASHARRETA